VGYDVYPFAKGEMVRVWLDNFEDGSDAGTFTFTGRWSVACRTAVDSFGYPGPCPKKSSNVEVLMLSLDVTFG